MNHQRLMIHVYVLKISKNQKLSLGSKSFTADEHRRFEENVMPGEDMEASHSFQQNTFRFFLGN